MKRFSIPDNRGWSAGLLLALFAPLNLLADPVTDTAAALPAATGPLADQLVRELAVELPAAGTADRPEREAGLDLTVDAEDLPLLLPASDTLPQDPLAAYQARQGKPSSGWRLNYDRYWEEVTFNWRVGF